MTDTAYAPGPIACRGAFSGEFGLGDELPIEQAPYVIERDRINEGVLPGFNRKLLPLAVDPDSGERTAGGYYLLDTPSQAKYMFDWYQDPVDGFVLDGIPILSRAYFREPVAHWWEVIGAEDFKPLATNQRVVRFERWQCSHPDARRRLEAWWPIVRDAAAARQLSSVWLLFNPQQRDAIGLISVADRVGNGDPTTPDLRSVRDLAAAESLGATLERDQFARRSFDRTSWIYSIWFPYDDGVASRPTLWPNSPPLPGL